MKIIKYKCDRCFKEVSINDITNMSLENIRDDYELLSMELCTECTKKLTQFLGVSLIEPDELPFE